MAHQEQFESSSSSTPETLDQSQSPDSSLSRNLSFSKLNARAPAFVPARPQTSLQHQQVAVVSPTPPPPPPPPPPPAVVHLYPSAPPPPPSPFHVPLHGVSHVIPAQNHHHQQQQYVPLRNHNSNHHYASLQYHHHHQQHQNHYSSKKGQSTEHAEQVQAVNRDAASLDHSSKNDKIDKNALSEEATQKLVNQVEYYFSDLNLATTDHLMRFINKDPEGYVPISVVASFKKIKAAVSSNSQLATILRKSSKLEVSEDGRKVRRQHPLTESDVEELQSRIVVAENLPEDHCHQNLMKIFSAVGSVKTIRTCPPQNSGSGTSSVSRSAKGDGMQFSNKLHAFVEYESVEIAEKSVSELNDEENWRSGLRVRLMLKRPSKPTQARGKKKHDGQGHSEEDEVSTSEQQSNEKQTEDAFQQHDVHLYEHPGEELANDKEGMHRKGRSRGRGKGRGRAQYHQNNRGNHVGTPPSNPVISEQSTVAKQPPGPRMPDGTRGFAMGRGKPVVNIA